MIIAAALYHVRDGSSIDLKMERQIPSKVRNPQNNQTPARLSGGNLSYAKKYEYEKERSGGGESWPHGLTLCSGLALGERGVHRPVDFS
jgi:hypothetical protein